MVVEKFHPKCGNKRGNGSKGKKCTLAVFKHVLKPVTPSHGDMKCNVRSVLELVKNGKLHNRGENIRRLLERIKHEKKK